MPGHRLPGSKIRRSNAWKPAARRRHVSAALRAYAALTSNAARGAVRDLEQNHPRTAIKLPRDTFDGGDA